MELEITPAELLPVVKRLIPHKKSLLAKAPHVSLSAENDVLRLDGGFDNSWSLPAKIQLSGRCTVDLQAFQNALQGYPKKEALRFVLHSDGLRFGTTKLTLHDAIEKIETIPRKKKKQEVEFIDMRTALLLAQASAAAHFQFVLRPTTLPVDSGRYLNTNVEQDADFHWFIVEFPAQMLHMHVGGSTTYLKVHKVTGDTEIEDRFGE